mgnify:CR=1 FL=1
MLDLHGDVCFIEVLVELCALAYVLHDGHQIVFCEVAKVMATSGIGGMAEKVRDKVDGLHARPASPEDLADRMAEALRDPGLWQRAALPGRVVGLEQVEQDRVHHP